MLSATAFGERLKQLRVDKKLTHAQLANLMFVSQSTISRWESGDRTPDITILSRLAECLGVSLNDLLAEPSGAGAPPVVIAVDDESIILNGSVKVLSETLPGAEVYGFLHASEALEFARTHQISVAFLDIELQGDSGLELAEQLRVLNPQINVVFVTSHAHYSGDAWTLHASGFLSKPLKRDKILHEVSNLRNPVRGLME